MAITKVTNSVVGSGSATDGYVLTADGSGNSAWEEAGGGAVSAVANGADNRIATFSSSTALNGEANLTFTGTAFTAQSTGALTTVFGSLQNTANALNLTTTGGVTAGIFLAAPTADHSFGFQTGGTERMRIDSSGRLLHNNDGSYPTDKVYTRFGVTNEVTIKVGGYGSSHTMMQFLMSGNNVKGSITSNTSSTAYNTSSDYRLKENLVTDWDATTRLKQLNPLRFNFIEDADTTVDGFLAHEVQDIVPEAITGIKDAMTEEVLYVEGDELPEGKSIGDVKTASVPDYQGIDQSKLVPLLVKTIQELEARITTLENA